MTKQRAEAGYARPNPACQRWSGASPTDPLFGSEGRSAASMASRPNSSRGS